MTSMVPKYPYQSITSGLALLLEGAVGGARGALAAEGRSRWKFITGGGDGKLRPAKASMQASPSVQFGRAPPSVLQLVVGDEKKHWPP